MKILSAIGILAIFVMLLMSPVQRVNSLDKPKVTATPTATSTGVPPVQSVNSLAWSHDNRYLAIGHDSGKFEIIEAATRDVYYVTHLERPIVGMKWSPDDAFIAINLNTVSVYDLLVYTTGSLEFFNVHLKTFHPLLMPFDADNSPSGGYPFIYKSVMAWSSDSRKFVAAATNSFMGNIGIVPAWLVFSDPETGTSVSESLESQRELPENLSWNPDGTELIGDNYENPTNADPPFFYQLSIWKVSSDYHLDRIHAIQVIPSDSFFQVVVQNLQFSAPPHFYSAWSPDGKYIAESDDLGYIDLINPIDGSIITQSFGTWGGIPVWSPDSKSFSLADSREIVSFSTPELHIMKRLAFDSKSFSLYAWTPDLSKIAGESAFSSQVIIIPASQSIQLTAEPTFSSPPVAISIQCLQDDQNLFIVHLDFTSDINFHWKIIDMNNPNAPSLEGNSAQSSEVSVSPIHWFKVTTTNGLAAEVDLKMEITVNGNLVMTSPVFTCRQTYGVLPTQTAIALTEAAIDNQFTTPTNMPSLLPTFTSTAMP